MNIYEKMNKIKTLILNSNLKKSGKNKFAGFDYYELADLIPTILKGCEDNKLYTHTTFSNDIATLKIINVEKPDEVVEFTSPMRNLELRGCNEIQALGGIETYSRRYLFLMAFDIVEADSFDADAGSDKVENVKEIFPQAQEIKTPTLEEITNIMIDNNYTLFTAQEFYNYYNSKHWKTGEGKPITNVKNLLKAWEDRKKTSGK